MRRIGDLECHLKEISELYIDRIPLKEICKKFDASLSTVQRFLKLHKLIGKRKKYEDITNRQFGKLTAISYIKKIKGAKKGGISHLWKCQCECGEFTEALIGNLKTSEIRKGCRKCLGKFFSETKRKTEIPNNILASIKWRTLRNKYENNLTPEFLWKLFLKQDKKCVISGVEIGFRDEDGRKNSASLDRIDSTKGYLKTNVQWVHKRIQIMKNNISDNEFNKWCSIVHNFQTTKDNGL